MKVESFKINNDSGIMHKLKLFPLFSGIIAGMSMSIVSAQVPEIVPTFPIVSPDDARTHGLEDLRKAKLDIKGPNLSKFLKSGSAARKALLQLGKIAFWDQQIGSGGKAGIPGQACASCHFHAGADNRARNQLNPDLLQLMNNDEGKIIGLHNAQPNPDTSFQTRHPNQKLRFSDFPFVRFIDEPNNTGNSNDVASSQGVLRTEFRRVIPANPNDRCRNVNDPVFQTIHGKKVRRVEPRHTPTVMNAFLTSFFAFWDGRANPFYNGQNPFGVQDPDARILIFDGNTIVRKRVDIPFSSLASQASGPPLSDFEMSCGVPEKDNARTWPEIGKKLFRKKDGEFLLPLGQQLVAKNDSVLGSISNFPLQGVNTTYQKLIKTAFKKKYWSAPGFRVLITSASVTVVQPARPLVETEMAAVPATFDDLSDVEEKVVEPTSDETGAPVTENPEGQRFRLIEANASLFIPMALQAYQQTLITDNTWFDRWMRTGNFNKGFGSDELDGLNVFVNKGKCINCHGGPELTNASVRNAQAGTNGFPNNIIEPMIMGNNNFAIYDNGFYNIGVTPTFQDVGRGGKGPTGAPLSSSRQRLFEENGIMKIPFEILGGDKIPSVTEDESEKVCDDVNGNGFCDFNESLQPAFQRVAVDGSMKTPGLRMVDKTGPYFHNGSAATLKQVVEFYDNGGNFCNTNIANLDPDIQPLGLSSSERRNLVKFLQSLNDQRVLFEQGRFDHPSLTVADSGRPNDAVIKIPVVGKDGRKPLGIPPLDIFLGLNQQKVGNAPDKVCSKNVN